MSANDKARTSNDVLSGSVNSIIGQLMRQKKAYEDVGKSTLDYIAADKKASEETKEHARALLAEVDALKKLDATRRAMPTSTVVGNGTGGKSDFRLEQERIAADNERRRLGLPTSTVVGNGTGSQSDFQREQERNANDPFLNGMARWQRENDAWQRGMNQMKANHAKELADRQKMSADLKSQAERDSKDPFLTGMARFQKANDPFQRGLDTMARDKAVVDADREYRIRKARERDAFERQDYEEKDNQNRIRQRRADNMEKRRREHENESKKNNSQWAGVEGFRAIEDFAQGSAYGGLRGGLLAASNNIGQMGAEFGAAGAMVGSVVSTVIVLGSTLYESWRKGVSGANEAEHALKMYDRALSETIPHILKLNELKVARLDMRDMDAGNADAQVKHMSRDLDRAKLDLKEKEAAEAELKAGMGIVGLSSADLKKEKRKRDDTFMPFAQSVVETVAGMTPVQQQLQRLSVEVLSDESIEKIRKLEQEKIDTNRVVVEMETNLLKQQQAQLELRRNADIDAERSLEAADQRRLAHERGGRGSLTAWEQLDESRARRNAQNQKEADKFTRGQSWVQSRSEDLLLSGMTDPKDQAAYRAQKEFVESNKRTWEAANLGIITRDEGHAIQKQSQDKRDRDIREAKFGNLQADGNSGFQSADIKSTQGVNAVIKAMRYSEQDKTIQELKKNGDIAAETLKVQQQVFDIMQKAPTSVVDF